MTSSPNPRQILQALAEDLPVGSQSGNQLCPFCQGGNSREMSLSLSREAHSVLFLCHRASCGRKGKIPITTDASRDDKTPISSLSDRRTAFLGSRIDVPKHISEILKYKYDLVAADIHGANLKWCPQEDGGKGRLWMPVLTPRSNAIGCVLRTLDKDVKPKTRTFIEDVKEPLCGWYRGWGGGLLQCVLIVEDLISAIKAKRHVAKVVSLLGCGMDPFKARQIQTVASQDNYPVIMGLDPDAFEVALTLKSRYRAIIPTMKVCKPLADFKDMEDQDIRQTLRDALG